MSENASYQVLVIGAGPGGYVAAIRAAQLGFSVACIEKWNHQGKQALGGTCLNVGCIPSKALLHSSELYHQIQHQAAAQGIEATARLNVPTMMQRKQAVVDRMTSGIGLLFKKNKVTSIYGRAAFVDAHTVQVFDAESDAPTQQISFQQCIIATGSEPVHLPFLPVDQQKVLDSTGALALQQVPQKLGIIGAGIIALEMGSVWSRLGAEVHCFEQLETFLPFVDNDIARLMQRELKQQGVPVDLGASVKTAEVHDQGVRLQVELKGEVQSFDFDAVLVAIGRKPFTKGLALEKAGLSTNERGQITVNDYCQSAVPHIYAIGDLVRGPMLAHKAEEEGVLVAERLAGQLTEMHLSRIPGVMYTWPELAWVGENAASLKQQGIPFNTGSFPFGANGRAWAVDAASGKVTIHAHAETDEILGACIMGPNASELLAEVVLAMEMGASAEDLARTVHSHPTLSESVKEAALAVDKRAIHS